MQIVHLQKAGMERHDRLRFAREGHFAVMKDAAESLGVPYGTYSGHEKGSRGIKDEELILYARRFHVSLAWLAFGEGEMDVRASADTPLPGASARELVRLPGRPDTARTPNTTYIQAELSVLRSLLSGALQNESIPEEQADAYADAVVESLIERTTASLVLRLEDGARIDVEPPAPGTAGLS